MFHDSKVAKSILRIVIGCWPTEWVYQCIYTLACFSHVSDVTGSVLSYRPLYSLCASWTLAGNAEPVSVVILVYSARQSSDFYKVHSLSYNLPIAGRGKMEFIPFPSYVKHKLPSLGF